MKIIGLKITDIDWTNNRRGNKIEVYRIDSKGNGSYHEYKATPGGAAGWGGGGAGYGGVYRAVGCDVVGNGVRAALSPIV